MTSTKRVYTAGKDHGPCDLCGQPIKPGQRYKRAFREATETEISGPSSKRRQTFVKGGVTLVVVKEHERHNFRRQ